MEAPTGNHATFIVSKIINVLIKKVAIHILFKVNKTRGKTKKWAKGVAPTVWYIRILPFGPSRIPPSKTNRGNTISKIFVKLSTFKKSLMIKKMLTKAIKEKKQ